MWIDLVLKSEEDGKLGEYNCKCCETLTLLY